MSKTEIKCLSVDELKQALVEMGEKVEGFAALETGCGGRCAAMARRG